MCFRFFVFLLTITAFSLISWEVHADDTSEPSACTFHSPYWIISRNRTDSIDSDVLIRRTKAPLQQCVYVKQPDDFELIHVNTNDFLFTYKHYLFLGGVSCACGGGFDIYDLDTHAKVYEGTYAEESNMHVAKDIVFFVTSIGDGTLKTCGRRKYNEAMKHGLDLEMHAQFQLNLNDWQHTGKVTPVRTSSPRCVITQ